MTPQIASTAGRLTVGDLRAALADLPGDLPIRLEASFDGMTGSGWLTRVAVDRSPLLAEHVVTLGDAETA